MPRVAVIGSGVSGLAAAWRLAAPGSGAEVTLFEASGHFGGHAHTVDLTLAGSTGPVDCGFLVFNPATYPRFVQLLVELGVAAAPAGMSFSVQSPRRNGATLEWAGTSLAAVFAQRGNLLRWRHWAMLAEILRFNRLASAIARRRDDSPVEQSVGDFLFANRFGSAFCDDYLLPMIGCIWSCPTEQMLRFPVATLIRFCHNHGLLQITDRPQWQTVAGGSRQYVNKMLMRIGDARLNSPVRQVQRLTSGVVISTDRGSETFDAVVFACHSDQTLALLGARTTSAERQILGAFHYQANHAVLHTDASVLPANRRAWAAWNCEIAPASSSVATQVCVHYLINRLQPLPWPQPVIVSLNPVRPIADGQVHARFDFEHPVFDAAAIAAQRRVFALQGRQRTWFCGAWCGYGFHEDGLSAGLAVADDIHQTWSRQGLINPTRIRP